MKKWNDIVWLDNKKLQNDVEWQNAIDEDNKIDTALVRIKVIQIMAQIAKNVFKPSKCKRILEVTDETSDADYDSYQNPITYLGETAADQMD